MARDSSILSQCEARQIQSKLLRDLLHGDVKDYFPDQRMASNFLNNGHLRNSPARQVLTYIIRRALGIVRLPGTYDVRMRKAYFDHLSPELLDEAVSEAKLIYEHTQSELRRVWGKDTLYLERGIKNEEAAAVRYFLDEIKGDQIPFYLSTLTFFNHQTGTHSPEIDVGFECPVEWIWASEYTLQMLQSYGSCEEFIVACNDPSGMVNLPRSAFISRRSPPDCQHVEILGYHREKDDFMSHALAKLVHEGLEPHDLPHPLFKYQPGKWESRCRKWADHLINLAKRWDARSKAGRIVVDRIYDSHR